MEMYILIALAVVLIVMMAAVIAMLARNGKGGNPAQLNGKFSEEQEDYITGQMEGLLDVVKDKIAESKCNVVETIKNTAQRTDNSMANSQQGLNKGMNDFTLAQQNSFNSLESKLSESISNIRRELTEALNTQRKENSDSNNNIRQLIDSKVNDMRAEVTKSLGDMRQESGENNKAIRDLIDNKVKDMQVEVTRNLTEIRQDNESKLNQIRNTVEDKLQETLNTKISESFKAISDQLLAVNKGLGEMVTLTDGVTNLNKVMSNVKTRGIWGEVSLENLIRQILSPSQYGTQVQVTGTREAVDVAIYMPGQTKGETVALPIDAKFPLADYERLVEASEQYDKEAVEAARKALIKRVKEEAKSISTKYIHIPDTTNFAVMYLPIEGLFAEVVKEVGLLDELQSKHNIVISGPTTLTALLNSLQIGFKTMQIQEKSADVWKALSNFKREFGKFEASLEKVQKNVNTIGNSIEDSLKNTKKINKVLDNIGEMESIEGADMSVNLLGGVASDEM